MIDNNLNWFFSVSNQLSQHISTRSVWCERPIVMVYSWISRSYLETKNAKTWQDELNGRLQFHYHTSPEIILKSVWEIRELTLLSQSLRWFFSPCYWLDRLNCWSFLVINRLKTRWCVYLFIKLELGSIRLNFTIFLHTASHCTNASHRTTPVFGIK